MHRGHSGLSQRPHETTVCTRGWFAQGRGSTTSASAIRTFQGTTALTRPGNESVRGYVDAPGRVMKQVLTHATTRLAWVSTCFLADSSIACLPHSLPGSAGYVRH